MKSLVEDLDAAVGVIEPDFSVADLRARANRRRMIQRRRAALGFVGLVAVLIGAFVLTSTWEREAVAPPADAPTPPTAGQGVFAQPTGTALVFDDGYDGVATLDLDTRRVTRRLLEGQRAGDQPYRLFRADNSFVVGWGSVYASPIDGGRSQKIGEATIAIPAAEPGRVWLATYASGRVDGGANTLRQVDLSGRVRIAARAGPGGIPAAGIPGGVAFETPSGIVLWNGSTGQVARLGTGNAFVSDVAGDKVAWCESDCRTMHITELGGGDLLLEEPTLQARFLARAARFDPQGRRLAVAIEYDFPGFAPGVEVRLYYAEGAPPARYAGISHYLGGRMFRSFASAVWSDDGKRLFVVALPEAGTELFMYTLADQVLERALLPISVMPIAIGLDRDRATSLLDAPMVSSEACRAPTIQPSVRASACAYVI